jgi:anti-sigma factor RsiW
MKMDNKTITDLDIQALVDGEIDDKSSVSVMAALNRDPVLYNRYLVYKKQKLLLKSWWKDN